MGNNNYQETGSILTTLLFIFIAILIILVIIYITLLIKRRNQNPKIQEIKASNPKGKKEIESNETKQQNIFNFMEFEKVEDNMIIQKENFKYIMVVECQGVNYDLMSGVEKTAVEEGFLQFLNTLRHPIQLYVQTRTIDLGSSINAYKERVFQIEADLNMKKQQYNEMMQSRRYTNQDKQKMLYEITKQTNLYEYGKDIIADTEKMSLNKNILSKKYYIVIPYYPSDLGSNEFDQYEVRNIAFSELYTRSQAIIRTLGACGVNGKILNTRELIELLYMAYNRDQAEDFGIDKAISAQYDKLYSTSEDIFDKKIEELDKMIEEKAVKKVVEKVERVRSRKEQEAIEKENKMDELINEMAKIIVEENKDYIGTEVAEDVLKDLEGKENTKKEVKVDAKEEKGTKKSTRTRKKAN